MLEAILSRRFPGSSSGQVAAATNAIMGLEDGWEEIMDGGHYFGAHVPAQCDGICHLANEALRDSEVRVYRRRLR